MQSLLNCRELDDLHSGAIKKGALPDSRPEGTASPQDGDLVSVSFITMHVSLAAVHTLHCLIKLNHILCRSTFT